MTSETDVIEDVGGVKSVRTIYKFFEPVDIITVAKQFMFFFLTSAYKDIQKPQIL